MARIGGRFNSSAGLQSTTRRLSQELIAGPPTSSISTTDGLDDGNLPVRSQFGAFLYTYLHCTTRPFTAVWDLFDQSLAGAMLKAQVQVPPDEITNRPSLVYCLRSLM